MTITMVYRCVVFTDRYFFIICEKWVSVPKLRCWLKYKITLPFKKNVYENGISFWVGSSKIQKKQ